MEAVPSTGTTTRASAAAAADFKDPSQEISAWLAKLSNFDLRHCLPAVLPGLESKVSAVSAKFDPISSLDDEFYTYTGGKDADGECHGSGAMEYDDGSYLAGAWTHGVRQTSRHWNIVYNSDLFTILSNVQLWSIASS